MRGGSKSCAFKTQLLQPHRLPLELFANLAKRIDSKSTRVNAAVTSGMLEVNNAGSNHRDDADKQPVF